MELIKSTLQSYLLSHVLLHFKRNHGKEEHLIAVTWVQTPEKRHVINGHIALNALFAKMNIDHNHTGICCTPLRSGIRSLPAGRKTESKCHKPIR